MKQAFLLDGEAEFADRQGQRRRYIRRQIERYMDDLRTRPYKKPTMWQRIVRWFK